MAASRAQNARQGAGADGERGAKTIVVPPGYHVELVASEPLVVDPIAIDFDADGRLWVLEMPGFMPDTSGRDSHEPINDVVVLEDTNNDGVMDKRTVFADGLVLPRAIKVLGRPRARRRAAEPVADEGHGRRSEGRLEGPRQQHVRPRGGQHRAQREQPVLGARQLDLHVRARLAPALEEWQVRDGADAQPRPVGRDAGRRRAHLRNVNDSPLFVDYVSARYYTRNPNLVRTRGLYDSLISREDTIMWPVRQTRGVNRGYRDQFFRPDDSSVTIQGVGTPVIYRGDRLPKELHGDAFITDSPTNLVHRYKIVDDGTGPAARAGLLQEGRDLRLPGRAVPAGEPVGQRARRHALTSSTCIAASCRRRCTGPITCATTSRRATSSSRSSTAASGASCTTRPNAIRRRRCRKRPPRNWCRRCRIRTAGGAIPRSSCSCNAPTSRLPRS